MIYDTLIYIGRFQPFHLGHLHIVEKALELANNLIILCGSVGQARTLRNPWTFSERKAMIMDSLPPAIQSRVCVLPLHDHLYDEAAWVHEAQEVVATAPFAAKKMGIIGYFKDETSYYLNSFPEWPVVCVNNFHKINAEYIRYQLLTKNTIPVDAVSHLVAEGALVHLKALVDNPDYARLVVEHNAVCDWLLAWELSPYPITFVAADAMVTHQDNILLVERKSVFGRGLLALPGGFLEPNENLRQCAARELLEETGINVGKQEFKATKCFDHPKRSTRGRVITQAFYFVLPESAAQPEPQGGSDAARAFWLPLAEVPRDKMFEDHWDIIQHFLKWCR